MLNKPKNMSTVGIMALVLLITGSIDSIRNLPATALFGTNLIFFFLLASLTFLLPTALVSAQLASTPFSEGGIYGWVKTAFGKKIAFLAIWLQWINTMVWYPTILSFIAGTATFIFNPHLAENKLYLISIIIGSFWTLTFINLRGIKTSATFASICALTGMVIPMALIIGLAILWLILGEPLQLHFHTANLLPNLHQGQSWISLTAIITAFLGMELATVHVQSVHQPQKTFPRAIFISVIIILLTMLFGALAIAFVVPANEIILVNGIMQAFSAYFAAYHLSWLLPVLTVMLLIGSFGGIINWIISPVKGLLYSAKDGFLPEFLTKENKHGVAGRILILQAILVTIVCLAFLFMPSVNGSYWLLTDLSTQLYVLMYVIMFLAALVLHHQGINEKALFQIPGGHFGKWFICLLGLIGCAIALIVGFFPPANINVGSFIHYELMFGGGILVMVLPALFFCYKSRGIEISPLPLAGEVGPLGSGEGK